VRCSLLQVWLLRTRQSICALTNASALIHSIRVEIVQSLDKKIIGSVFFLDILKSSTVTCGAIYYSGEV
jgi:hypothetical protein